MKNVYESKDNNWVENVKSTWSHNQAGWICPKCARIWAPWVQECVICNLSTKNDNIKDIQEET